MSKISIYEVVPVPKLADKLVGTSVGGDPEDITYNFTLSELLNLFIPNIPGNTLQGVLDFGNTATQDINLTGIITTTTLNVGSTANILNSNLTGQTHITGGLYDRLNSIGTAGQVLTSTGTQVEWYTIPTVIPDLQQVLAAGNTAVNNIILTGNLSANNAALLTSTISTSLTVLGTLRDGLSSVGTNNQVLSSNVTGVRWVNLPVYSATSPLLYNSGTGVFSIQQANASQSGYLSSADWITFDGKQTAISLTTTGNSGASTLVGATINVPNYTLAGLGGVPQTRTLTINGVTYNLSADRSWTLATGVSSVSATTPLFSTGGVNPDISIQQSSSSLDGYLSNVDWLTFNSKQPAGNYITSLTGEATAVGPGAAAVILSNAAVIGKLLTGLSITGSAITSSDSILTAFGKVQNQINGLIGGVQFQGVWNAATNTPALVSSVGTQGYYYIVDVAGNTNLNGITDWQVGDWAIFNGSTWNKVDNTDLVTSVNGQVGAVSLTTDNIPEGTTNLYYLDSRARAALSFAAGSGAYNSTTGVITIPTDNSQILNGAGYITLVSLSATSPLSYNNLTGAFSIQVANTTQNGYLSSADWNTFNGKQDYLNGTGLVKSVAGVISYITDNSANWNTAYNDSIVSAAVTGTATKTLTLNQQDGGTITASWSDIDTGLTSVGVSMPSAFTVTNSPLTSNGTIAITGSGNTLQYVDGTGALQSFPSLTGYVPYTGATANVNLGIYNLTAASLIKNGGTSGQFLKADGSVDSSAYIVLGSLSATAPLSYNNTTGVFTISQSGASTNGYLSSTDWNTFNNKQATITLTTTGSSGASTLIGNTLNIPNYANLVTSVFGRIGAVVATEGDYSLTQLSDVTITTPSSGQVLKYNGTAWVNDIDTDTGITSLNGLTALTQTFAVGTSGTDFAISSVTSTHTFNLPTASVSNRGALSSADWTTFNSKEPAITAGTTLQYYRGDKTFQTLNTTVVPEGTNLYYLDSRARTAISLTTTGSSGVSTYNNTTGVFNIPDYGSALSGYVPTSRQLSINGTQYDLSADRSWSVGTVTTVSFTLGASGTDLNSSVVNSTTTPAITLNVPTASAANRGALSAADWSTFNTKVGGVTATTPLFSSGGSTPNLTIQQSSGSQAGYLSSTDWTTFNNKQAAGNYITSLTGEATATGPGAAAVTLDNAAVTGKILTGVNITGGTILSTDSILTGFGKLQNQVNGLIGGSIYQGTWNANTNTPTLTSSVGTAGYYYIVSVAGTTNLNGITDWQVGDWAIFNGGVWQKVDNTDSVISVNGQTGAVSLTTDNISEGVTNLYYLDSRARAALSFVAGSGAYNSSTGAITIPTNTSQLTNGANFITLGSLSGTAPISYNSGTGAISITQSGTASNGYLSSTDWNTFNNKQATISLTTTGTSGAATLVGATLNVPNYGSALTGYVPYTGATANVDLGGFNITAGGTSSFVAATLTSNLWLKNTGTYDFVISNNTSLTTNTVRAYYTTTDELRFYAKNTAGASVVPKIMVGDGTTFTQLGTGTVTSVAANAGTGISITGSPITTSGTFCITNTSPYGGEAVIVLGTGASSTIRCGNGGSATGLATASLGGCFNCATGPYDVVVGGYNNKNTSSTQSFIGGGCQNLISTGSWQTIAGGIGNCITAGGYNFIGGGYFNSLIGGASESAIVVGGTNTISSGYSGILAGRAHNISAHCSSIAGGSANNVSGCNSFIGGGSVHSASGFRSGVVSGCGNVSSGSNSFIGGGAGSTASGACSAVGGGQGNTATAAYSTISGGLTNTASGAHSAIGGGCCNIASCNNVAISGGRANTASGGYSSIGGGLGNEAAGGGGSTVSGGYFNQALGLSSAIGGGCKNYVGALGGFIGGGNCNNVYNPTSGCLAYGAVVVGGVGNNTSGGTWSLATCTFTLAPTFSASGAYSFIGGGFQNRATGTYSTVSGGYKNSANAYSSSTVGGGACNNASSCNTTVSGGYGNTAGGDFSTVGGGILNTATGGRAIISGGQQNAASGAFASVAGGRANIASGACSTVGGGCANTSSGVYTVVSGGELNLACSARTVVAGGLFNCATNDHSAVSGGRNNTASGACSTVAGGQGNTANSTWATVSGGALNVASGNRSAIGGGTSNVAAAANSTVGGGSNNTASNAYAVVAGGYASTASGSYSFIGSGSISSAGGNCAVMVGGKANAASGNISFVGGGCSNTASGGNSVVVGGSNHTANGSYSFVGGGYANVSSALEGTVVGGGVNYAGGIYSFVGAGLCNIICSPTSTCLVLGATIAGGIGNNTTGGTWSLAACDFTVAPTKCVAGQYSTIGGGFQNRATGTSSFVGGGMTNISSGIASTVGGGCGNCATSNHAFVGGGLSNTATTDSYALVAGGYANTTSSAFGAVTGGRNNSASNYRSFVGGGYGNIGSGADSVVVGGQVNTASGEGSFIGGGCNNSSSGSFTFIGGGDVNQAVAGARNVISGGQANRICGSSSGCNTIGGGWTNCITTGFVNTIGGGFNNRIVAGSYHIIAGGYSNQISSATESFIGSGGANTVSANYSAVVGGQSNTASGVCSFVGGGRGNSASGSHSTASGGKNNISSGGHTTVGGGCTNTASSGSASTVAGGRINTASGAYSFVGGGLLNSASGGVGSTVSGGYQNSASGAASFVGAGISNTASGACSFVGGGFTNTANCNFGFAGGGCNNLVTGNFHGTVINGQANSATANYAFVGNGLNNVASGTQFNVVVGGRLNTASGDYTFIGGGYANTVSGIHSVIGGGTTNTAVAPCSFIGGGYCNLINVSSTWGTILGGTFNCSNSTINSHIIGSCIPGVANNYTFVNNLCQWGGGISDCRRKNTIQDTGFGLDDIVKLRPVSYCWNGDKSCHKKYGFIAQEVQQAMACVVETNPIARVDKNGLEVILEQGGSPILQFEKDAIYASYVNAFKEIHNRLLKLENKS